MAVVGRSKKTEGVDGGKVELKTRAGWCEVMWKDYDEEDGAGGGALMDDSALDGGFAEERVAEKGTVGQGRDESTSELRAIWTLAGG